MVVWHALDNLEKERKLQGKAVKHLIERKIQDIQLGEKCYFFRKELHRAAREVEHFEVETWADRRRDGHQKVPGKIQIAQMAQSTNFFGKLHKLIETKVTRIKRNEKGKERTKK